MSDAEGFSVDPQMRSWIESANDPAGDFPIQSLPLCAFFDEGDNLLLGVRIGDRVVDVGMLHDAGLLGDDHHDHDLLHLAMEQGAWNMLAAGDGKLLAGVRGNIQRFLREGPPGGQQSRRLREKALLAADQVEFALPVVPENYTDFYASLHHATTVGSMFRPDNPLLPNYKHVPIGYHGRASSIVPTGTAITRPKGQTKKDDAPGSPETPPTFGPCAMLDYELEVGVVIARGNHLGEPVPVARAHEFMLGLCLVNDWSARDVQRWEYQPLGPFLAKNFATSMGDCVVTMDALEPFRVPALARAAGDPKPLEYLSDKVDSARGGFAVTLEVSLRSSAMRERGAPPVIVSKSDAFREMYWTFAQMIAHHTSNGCNLFPGDLLASGTVSGKEPAERGCLLERTWAGRGSDGKPLPRAPITLPTGETRTFLHDGDEVIMKGYCERPGFRRIGLGTCSGVIAGANK
jgi:fumarylacetoacetase